MLKLLLAVAATVAFVVFVMMNMHHVTLSFVVGPPVKIRLIFLLGSTFVLGILSTVVLNMVWRVQKTRPKRKEASSGQSTLREQP